MPPETCPGHILVRAFFRVSVKNAGTRPRQSYPAAIDRAIGSDPDNKADRLAKRRDRDS